MSELRQAMGNRIRALREAKGLSQRGLAAALGTTPSTVNGWENGRNKPEDQLLLSLAKTLATSISYLYGETDDPRPAPDWYTGAGANSETEARIQAIRDKAQALLNDLAGLHDLTKAHAEFQATQTDLGSQLL